MISCPMRTLLNLVVRFVVSRIALNDTEFRFAGINTRPYGVTMSVGRVMAQILVVDDEVGLLKIIERRLRQNSFDVLTAQNGDGARRAFYENEVDCLCLDINLPDIDGLDLLEELRRNRPSLSAIIMSGSTTHKMQLRAEKQEVLGFLFKPFRLSELTGLLIQFTEIVEVRGARGVKETKRRWTQREE